MKKLMPLRNYVSLQFGAVTFLPVLLIALLVWLFLFPLIKKNISIQHLSIARAVAGQISAHLLGGERQLTSLASVIDADGGYSPSQMTKILDAACGQGELFESMYLASAENKVISEVGLAGPRQKQRGDLQGLDLSGRRFFYTATEPGKTIWSETFLSTVSSQMAIAVTVLVHDKFLVGEITLGNLSKFISLLPVEAELRTVVLDRRGRVVADSLGLMTGQKVEPDLWSATATDSLAAYKSFRLEGQNLVGSVVDINRLGWKVLVTERYRDAFRYQRAVVQMVAVGLALALSITLIFSWYQAGKITRTVQTYIGHAKAIAEGKYTLQWPPSQTAEDRDLANSLQAMARQISQREQQLIDSESHMSITLDSIGDAVITTNEHGLVTRLNPVAEQLTGWPSEEAIGRDLPEVFDIINSHTRRPVTNPVDLVLASGEIVGLANDTMLLARDGREFQIADSGAPIRNAEGGILGVVLVFRDVTEVYGQQQIIAKSEMRLRELTANVPGVVYQCRVAKDYSLINEFVGGQAAEIFGLQPDSASFFADFSQHIPASDRDNYLQSLRESVDAVKPWRYRGAFNKANGETIWFTGSAVVKKDNADAVLYGVLTDVTWRNQLEKSLRLTQFCFDKASIGIFRVGEDAQILDVNEQGCASLGYSRDELCTKRIFDIDPNFNADIWPEHIAELRKVRSKSIRTLHQRKNGEIFPVQILINIMVFDGQEYRVAFVTDMSEWEAAQKIQQRLENQLHQAQKLEAIGKLAGGVAHDINNLLTPILGYGELLMLDPKIHPQARERIDSIMQAGKGARDLVRQLLAFSRRQVLAYKPLNINKVILEFENLIRRTIREDIEIHIITAPSIPMVMADVGQIEQVIMNLLVNASDAMPDGGKLTVETAVQELDEEFVAAHPDAVPGEYVMLAISDTGKGMDAETQARIFEPFFTTKGDLGTGLGLATVYGIIKQHNGNIWLNSEPGRGTTFKIYLPASPNTEQQDTQPPAGTDGLLGSETILLVEDNPKVQKAVFDILEQQGYTVICADDGPEALRIMALSGNRVDLLLSDVVMPEMSGRELYEKLSHDYPDLKVLYMSGYTDNSIVHHGVLDEGIQFIQKPFTRNLIATKIREILDGRV